MILNVKIVSIKNVKSTLIFNQIIILFLPNLMNIM